MTNLYLSLTDMKTAGYLNSDNTTYDAAVLDWLEGESRLIDELTQRHFFVLVGTRLLSPKTNRRKLYLPDDLISVTTFKEDQLNAGAFDLTWAPSDYILWPRSKSTPVSGLDDALPYQAMEIDRRTTGNQDLFLQGQDRYELVGKWGFWERTKSTGETVNDADFNDSESTFTASSGPGLKVGETILIGSEQMWISGIATDLITVTRGVNGTTAAAHVTAAAISRYVYPKPIVQALAMQTARVFGRRQGGWATTIGFTETGTFQAATGLDGDVRNHLSQFRRRGG